MKKRILMLALAVVLSFGVLLAFLMLMVGFRQAVAQASVAPEALSVTAVSPTSAPNDLDTQLMISGTGFVNGATAQVGNAALQDVAWVSVTRLEATLPWGLDPGIYTLTVTNPGGASASLPDALDVTQGIDMWTKVPGPEGGTIIRLVINPITPTILYAAPQDGGLFRSLDGGENWELVLDELAWNPSLSLGSDARTFYAGTGGRVADLWRSDDNGTTWLSIPIPGADGAHQVFAHPTQPDVIFAIVDNGGQGGDGLYRSDDRGTDWVTVTQGITDTPVTALAIDPTNPLTMALGTGNGKIFLSSDGGATWSFASTAPVGAVGALSFHPSGNGELWVTGINCGVVKSSAPDLSGWIPVEDWGGQICFGIQVATLSFAPLAWGEAYSQTVFYPAWSSLRMSSDGGLTWSDYGGWNDSFEPPRTIALHPTDPDTLYVGCNRLGVQVSTDSGLTWRVLQKGMTGISTNSMAPVPGHPDTVYAQSRDSIGVYKLEQGGAVWHFLPAATSLPPGVGESSPLALDPFNEDRLYLSAYHYILTSPDGGQTWPVTVTLSIPDEYAGCWTRVTSLVADPFSEGVLLAGVQHACSNWGNDPGGLYLSADYGESWMRLMAGEPISQVNDLAYDWGTPGVVYAAAAGSGVLRSSNGGLTWQPVNNGLENSNIEFVETEPVTPYRVYISGRGSLMVSEDQGANWLYVQTPPGGGYGHQALHFTSGNPAVLYIATGSGLYASTDGGASWNPMPEPLGSGVVWTLSSTSIDSRTVLYAGGAGGVYHLSSVSVRLNGTVTDADTSLPIAGAKIMLDTGVFTYTDTGGVYSFTLPSGVYTLTASADGYYSQVISGVELVIDEVVQDFALMPAPLVPEWAQVNQDGFGSPDYQISALETFQPEGSAPYLYAGVWGVEDAKMWRSSDGWNWEVASPSWLTPTASMLDAQAFHGQLYVGMSSPAQLWRTDGENWQAVDTVGFGDTNNHTFDALAVFEDKLYAAALNDVTGVEIWRSASGDPGTWSQVNQDGFGGWGSGDVVMDVFQGYLYTALASQMGSQLWRTSDGMTWQAVFTDGLGNPSNGRISMAEFNGELYISFRNIWEGGQIWHSNNGLDWELVVQGGFGEVSNGRPYGMIVADGALYVVLSNGMTGAQVWRTFDGAFWQRANLDGWGDPLNTFADYNDKAAAVFNFNLYVGTLNSPNGGEIWRLQLAHAVFVPMIQK